MTGHSPERQPRATGGASAEAAELLQLLAGWPHSPSRAFAALADERHAHFLQCLVEEAARRGATPLLHRQVDALAGFAQLERADWDSQLLGIDTGRINWLITRPQAGAEAARALVQSCVEESRRQGLRYLFARVPAADALCVQSLEAAGFTLVDGVLTFGRSLREPLPAAVALSGVRIESADPSDSEQLSALKEIAGASFSHDRFHSDPAIAKEVADSIYRNWIRNSVGGRADRVLVARGQEGWLGFLTIRIDQSVEKYLGIRQGVIELVATAARARGRGIARALSLAALEWMKLQNCERAQVGTQLANLAAARVYAGVGMLPVSSSLTLRLLL